MPREIRRKAETGIYYVMLRGIDRQQLFLDGNDCASMLKILRTCKEISDFMLYAYCLMGNHVHLLLKEGPEKLEIIMKRITIRYSMRFNRKYGRTGYLFQDRYRSEPVSNDSYFLTMLRYIHRNPVKAGLTDQVQNYVYISYREYIGKQEQDHICILKCS